MRPYSIIFEALRSIAGPNSRQLAELILWGLLAIISLTLVFLPGDQTLQGLEWLFHAIE